MQLLSTIAIPFLSVIAAFTQLGAETVIYQQKDNIKGYAMLEGKRKKWRDFTSMVFCLIGLLIGLKLSFLLIAPVIFGRIIYWILFDGLYATKVRKQSFWYVGITSKLDRFIKTEKRSKIFKLSLLIISLAGYVVNMIL